jgi:hypothetical protein
VCEQLCDADCVAQVQYRVTPPAHAVKPRQTGSNMVPTRRSERVIHRGNVEDVARRLSALENFDALLDGTQRVTKRARNRKLVQALQHALAREAWVRLQRPMPARACCCTLNNVRGRYRNMVAKERSPTAHWLTRHFRDRSKTNV